MSPPIDERLAGRMEMIVPRALAFFAGPGDGGGKEAAESGGPPGPQDEKAIAERIRAELAQSGKTTTLAGRSTEAEADGIAAELVAQANEVLADLRGGSTISEKGALALEAVLHTRGRPALKVEGGRLESLSNYPGAGLWRRFVDQYEPAMIKVASASGAVSVRDRVRGGQWVQGTAWLVRPDLAMTNRHALFPALPGTVLARRMPGATTFARIKNELEVVLDFALDSGPPREIRYNVIDVPFVADDRDPVDVALIRVAKGAASVEEALNPLALMQGPLKANHLYLVGHPGKMLDVPEPVAVVFGTPDGRKRCSFGKVMAAHPARPGEILHDASSIGGYSGACVMSFTGKGVAALHYYGDTVHGNRAIASGALKAHPVAKLLSA